MNIDEPFTAAQCSSINEFDGTNPNVLAPLAESPCSHVLFAESTSASRNITLNWNYPLLDDFTPEQLSALPFTNGVFGTATVVNLDVDLVLLNYQACDVTLYEFPTDPLDTSRLSFNVEYVRINTNTGRPEVETLVKFCDFSYDFQVSGDPTQSTYLMEALLPASIYQVTVTPFTMYTEPGEAMDKAYGPKSEVQFIKTADDIPEASPANFEVFNRRPDDIGLVWVDPPSDLSNGELVEYQVEVVGPSLAFTVLTEQNSMTILGLSPNTEYLFRVRGRTSALGFGPWSEQLNASTCGSDSRAVTSDTNPALIDECAPDPGFVLLEDSTTIDCTQISDTLDDFACNLGEYVSQLPVKEGFWRASTSSIDIRECPLSNSCVEGSFAGNSKCASNFTVSVHH